MTKTNESHQGPLRYLWHWWINSLKHDGPAGDPHRRNLYGFKSMLESLGYFESYLRRAFTDSLRETHQQCSHQQPEVIPKKNVVRCAMGKDVTECPILLSLKDSFEKNRAAYYKERVPESALYELMARTCGWHMLSAEMLDGQYIDWNEGAMQDISDRMFWDRTYQSLAQPADDLGRSMSYAEAMKLPNGKTCADCIHVKFCTGIGCTKPENTSCDYYPNRFGEPPLSWVDRHYQRHHAAVLKMDHYKEEPTP